MMMPPGSKIQPTPPHGNSQRAVLAARQSWEKAPLHVKTMAGQYMSPILQAIEALNMDIQDLKGAANGNNA